MSGRIKGVAASPEAEREQLRALTRALHEAAQDARAAARELREARAEVSVAVQDRIAELVNPLVNNAVAEVNEHLNAQALGLRKVLGQITGAADECIREAQECTELIENRARLTEARLMGYQTAHEVAAMATKGITDAIQTLARDQLFIDDVADAVASLTVVKRPG